jgi:ubiquinone biosynthesis protein
VFKQFKRHVPDWLEHLPQIPPMVFQALKNMQDAPVPSSAPAPEKNFKAGKLLNRIGAALAGVGVGLAFPHWAESVSQIPGSSLILVALGLLLLLLR